MFKTKSTKSVSTTIRRESTVIETTVSKADSKDTTLLLGLGLLLLLLFGKGQAEDGKNAHLEKREMMLANVTSQRKGNDDEEAHKTGVVESHV